MGSPITKSEGVQTNAPKQASGQFRTRVDTGTDLRYQFALSDSEKHK